MVEDQLANKEGRISEESKASTSTGEATAYSFRGQEEEGRLSQEKKAGSEASGGDGFRVSQEGWKKPITLTDFAVEKVKEIYSIQRFPDDALLRVVVTGGGCAGFSYNMFIEEVTIEDEDGLPVQKVYRSFDIPRSIDRVLEDKGIYMVVDEMSLMYLFGTEIDYTESLTATGFKFNNPSATSTCGCQKSFS